MGKVKRFLCLWCKGTFDCEKELMSHDHPCDPRFRMIDGTITVELSEAINMKCTRWGRFVDAILSVDIGFGLAFMGLVLMNCVLIRHIDLTFTESLIESLSLGFAIPRLLK